MNESSEDGDGGEFAELIRYTIPGYIVGLVLGLLLDNYGYQRSAYGQWLVRTFAGEGESIFEGFYSIRKRYKNASSSMAQAYGWGKLFGLAIPWIIDGLSRLGGVDVYGVQGFYIPYFYALSDQMGANISGMVYLKRIEGSWSKALSSYIHHPVMVASLFIIIIVPVGLFMSRIMGFSPTTQLYTAFETIASNLCWIPPLVGWLWERNSKNNGY